MADAAANVVARASRVRCEVEGEGGDVVCRIDGDVLEVMEPERVAAGVARDGARYGACLSRVLATHK